MTHRTDSNQKIIVDCFRRMGYEVLDLSAVGNGFPDIIIAKHGDNDLVEIKTEKGRLNELQEKFAAIWNAPVYVIRNVDEAIDFNNGNKFNYQIK